MAETLISPGVLARENDQSFITQQPITVGAAIIGPTVKGPVELPTVVTSYSEFKSIFGDVLLSGSDTYTYFTSMVANNYFGANGGKSLLVARVVSGSYTPAQSTTISNNVMGVGGNFASASVQLISAYTASSTSIPFNGNILVNLYNPSTATYTDWHIGANSIDVFDIDARLVYVSMSNPPASVDEFGSRLQAFFNSSSWGGATNTLYNYFSASYNVSSDVLTLFSRTSGSALNGTQIFAGYSGSGAITLFSPSSSYTSSFTVGGGYNGVTSAAFVLETISEGVIMNSSGSEDSNGVLVNGTEDNIRWEIQNPNTSSGTFDLIIRQGNDSTISPSILAGETYIGLSLDPKSPNFITRVIGDYVRSYNPSSNQIETVGTYRNASRYIRVKQVNYLTPDYTDNSGLPKAQYTASIPVAQSGSFTGATGDVKPGAAFYNSISTANNTQGVSGDDYDNMINLLSNKDDYRFNALFTPGLFYTLHSSKINTIIQNTQNRGDNIYIPDMVLYGSTLSSVVTQASSINSSYAATYWPWVQILDGTPSNKQVFVPASTLIPGVFANTDNVSATWFAPAGINRGGLGTVLQVERKLTQSDRDTLYTGKVNPIATFPGTGVVVYGQKTLQTKASALDRINVRRLLIELKSYISQVANNLVFEQNTVATRNQFLAQVNPYLENIQQRQGLYAFRVIMDASNNTPDVIDRNQLVGQIYLQPTKTAEFIYLDFNVTPTGATFPG